MNCHNPDKYWIPAYEYTYSDSVTSKVRILLAQLKGTGFPVPFVLL